MDKSISDYLSGFTNVCEGKFTIGREKSGKNEFIIIKLDGQEVYSFWHNPNKKVTNKKPKHTGGKKSYIMLMIEELKKHENLSLEAQGFIYKMLTHIQWNSTLIIDTRNKKPLVIDEMVTILGIGRNKTLSIIKELKAADLLVKDKDGYKVSPNLMQKGGAKHE
jgi:hypothetical protein